MSEVEGGDYELARVVESGTQEVLIPAIKDMGQTLEKVSSSVGAGADRVADTALEADATAARGLHDAENGLGGTPGEGGVHPTQNTNTPGGGGQQTQTTPSGKPEDNFGAGNKGGVGANGARKTPSCNDPIDPVSGRMLISSTDVDLPGVLPLILRRTYVSDYRHGGLLGPGWSSTLDERLVIDADGIHYLGDDAQTLNYGVPTQPGQRVMPAAGARWPLTWDRALDALEILDPATGVTRHFAAPPRDKAGGAEHRQVRHLTRITDRNDNWLAIARDEDGVPTEVDHIGGYRIAVDASYRGDGFRIEELRLLDPTQPEGALLVGYAYDPARRLVEILDTNNVPLIYEYDDADLITAWIDRVGYRFAYTYDAEGRVIGTSGEDGTLAATFAYDRDAHCTTVVDSYGAVTEYWYDEHNHLAKVVDPLGNPELTIYDRYGHLIEHADALGNTTRLVRDEAGNLLEVHRPDGSRVQAAYNDHHQATQLIAPSGAVSSLEYDDRGNLLVSTDPVGGVTRYAYTEHGGLATVTDALGNTTTITVNRAGLPTSITDPLGATWSVTRDVRGNVISSTDPLGNVTTTGYDVEGRPISRTHPDGSCETWTYGVDGEVTRHTNQARHKTSFDYGPFRRLRARTGPDGARYEFTHDQQSRLTKVTNPLGATWLYEYDAAGYLVAEQDFNGRRLTYAHDAAGRLTLRGNGAGQALAIVRDACGRVVEQRTESGDTTVYAYDADGGLVRADNGDAQIEITRDAAGRIVSETINGWTVSTGYDVLGNRASRTTPSGRASGWQYDAAGRPLILDAADKQISFGYDATGQETHRWLSSGTALTSEWDQLGRMTSRRLLVVSGPQGAQTSSIVHERTWAYRADGVPASTIDTFAGECRFSLDAAGRITGVTAAAWSEQYAYDAVGNLVNAVDSRAPESATTGPHSVSGTLVRQAGRTSYEYDAQGRLVSAVRRTLSGGRKVWSYSYDTYDRVIGVRAPDDTNWRYMYDALGRRIAKQRIGADDEIVEETRFAWDGPILVEEQRVHGRNSEVTATVWDYEPESWTPMLQDRRTYYAHAPQEVIDEQFHAIVTDLAGTPTELVTLSGTVAWRRSAGIWGTVVPPSHEAGSVECPLRFPGQYHDAETGLDYNFQRYYDSTTASYITPDPLGLDPSPNHHGYVDNPFTWIDPMGLAKGRKQGLRPSPDATGPHVTFRRDATTGQVVHYAEWQPQTNPRDPAPWELVKRVDMQGQPHFDKTTGQVIPTPHVNLPDGTARPTLPEEETPCPGMP